MVTATCAAAMVRVSTTVDSLKSQDAGQSTRPRL